MFKLLFTDNQILKTIISATLLYINDPIAICVFCYLILVSICGVLLLSKWNACNFELQNKPPLDTKLFFVSFLGLIVTIVISKINIDKYAKLMTYNELGLYEVSMLGIVTIILTIFATILVFSLFLYLLRVDGKNIIKCLVSKNHKILMFFISFIFIVCLIISCTLIILYPEPKRNFPYSGYEQN